MDKTVIFAVAGAGKTTHIINNLDESKRSLVVTYTNNNLRSLRESILKKFGYFPENITLLSYFTFLYAFCYRPFLSHKLKTKGINFISIPNPYIRKTDLNHYFDKHKRIYSNRIAKLLEQEKVLVDVQKRLVKYFDNMFIDEIQDFAGNDFNFLESISKTKIDLMFVGDFYQYTFDTSRDGNINQGLHSDFTKYKKRFSKMGLQIDTSTLNKSYRCSPTICEFIRDKIGIEIFSQKDKSTKIEFVDKPEDVEKLLKDREIVKLFYQEHYKYGCFSRNWGECKGEDRFNDVCVILNKTTLEHFKKDELKNLNPRTKNKLYVACSRSRNNLYFIPYNLIKK